MAHTTESVIDEPVDMERLYRLYENELTLGQAAELESLSQGTITIEVKGGCVIDVKGVPDGCDYEIIDYDNPEPVREGLYLTAMNILVRATSPDHAADTLHHIL